MPRASTSRKGKLERTAPQTKEPRQIILPNDLFPLYREERKPLPKQQQVYELIQSGAAQGGGVVFIGSLGCAKTLCLAAADIWVHHAFPGTNSLIGRESYPAFQTSTWLEYEKMLKRCPSNMISKISPPTKNAMGVIEWTVGGTTFFISLSDSDAYASANLGFVAVDEAHLQIPEYVEKLHDRLRQQEGPRVMLVVTNAAGHFWAWKMAHPKSRDKRPDWFWIESSVWDNPTLSPDYIRRLEAKYKPGTLEHKRWVKGESVPLEGSVFGNIFYAAPDYSMHLVPDHVIPPDWPRGRGIDYGLNHWTCCYWGALDKSGAWWIYRGYRDRQRSAVTHAEEILELEKGEDILWTPASHELWAKREEVDGMRDTFKSRADDFYDIGCMITPANTDRKQGLDLMFELMAVDETRRHPCTLKMGAPRIYILDRPDLSDLIDCLENVQWPGESRPGVRDRPDDIVKKDDDDYDALRYLLAERPDLSEAEPVRERHRESRGTRGYRGYR